MSEEQPQLVLPFPLRRGYIAQIVIPRDMSSEEAERLCEFVMSLAQSESAPLRD